MIASVRLPVDGDPGCWSRAGTTPWSDLALEGPCGDQHPWGYAYGWFVGHDEGRRIQWHSGGLPGFASYLARHPDNRVLVVLLSNRDPRLRLDLLASTAALVRDEP